jgi:hypothetical protein
LRHSGAWNARPTTIGELSSRAIRSGSRAGTGQRQGIPRINRYRAQVFFEHVESGGWSMRPHGNEMKNDIRLTDEQRAV